LPIAQGGKRRVGQYVCHLAWEQTGRSRTAP
jgi:hypothetical protein